jgi:hypothetical protein
MDVLSKGLLNSAQFRLYRDGAIARANHTLQKTAIRLDHFDNQFSFSVSAKPLLTAFINQYPLGYSKIPVTTRFFSYPQPCRLNRLSLINFMNTVGQQPV